MVKYRTERCSLLERANLKWFWELEVRDFSVIVLTSVSSLPSSCSCCSVVGVCPSPANWVEAFSPSLACPYQRNMVIPLSPVPLHPPVCPAVLWGLPPLLGIILPLSVSSWHHGRERIHIFTNNYQVDTSFCLVFSCCLCSLTRVTAEGT